MVEEASKPSLMSTRQRAGRNVGLRSATKCSDGEENRIDPSVMDTALSSNERVATVQLEVVHVMVVNTPYMPATALI